MDSTTRDLRFAKPKSIWIRSRTNAFAHKVTSASLARIASLVFVLQTLLVTIPIVCVGLSLYVLRSGQTNIPLLGSDTNSTVTILGIISIFCNGIALFLGMIANRFQWSERRLEHQKLLAAYQLIAQKARRLDDESLPDAERAFLCRHLEESFEMCKNTGVEPSDKAFRTANTLMRKLNAYPFGLTSADVCAV